MNGSTSDVVSTMALLVSLTSLGIKLQECSLHQRQEARHEQQYKDEKWEKSRPKVHVTYKGEFVELTIQALDPAGFSKTETITVPLTEWLDFLCHAPPVPRN